LQGFVLKAGGPACATVATLAAVIIATTNTRERFMLLFITLSPE
jgi:hypothetical protein